MYCSTQQFISACVKVRKNDVLPVALISFVSPSPPEFSLGLVDRIRGQYLDVSKCRVEWNHENDAEVGGSTVATVHVSGETLMLWYV